MTPRPWGGGTAIAAWAIRDTVAPQEELGLGASAHGESGHIDMVEHPAEHPPDLAVSPPEPPINTVDESSKQSFPCSDPPSSGPGLA